MLEIKNLSKKFDRFQLTNVSLVVDKGDYFVLLGISGAGKSVLLEIIAGIEKLDSGEIFLHKKNITSEKIQHRNVGLIYQDLAIFPHFSVRKNIAYSLQYQKYSRIEIEQKVELISQKLGIDHLLDRNPEKLSGGELQRVALARILMKEPEILLLDEPLSSLDVQMKEEIRNLLRHLNRNGQTIIHVTHDYEEAISLATKIAVIQNGELIQTGTPEEVFQSPKSEFIANFIGVKNFFKAEIKTCNDQYKQAFVKDSVFFNILSDLPGKMGYVMFGSNEVILSNEKPVSSLTNSFLGEIQDISSNRLGIEVKIDIGVKIIALITKFSLEKLNLIIGNKIWASFKACSIKFIPH